MRVRAIIEDPEGSTVRHHYDMETGRWQTRPHHATSQPWPANYGYIPGTWMAADDDELDVIVLSAEPLRTGDQIEVTAAAILYRPDGDHKILATMWQDPRYGSLTTTGTIPAHDIIRIEQWFAVWDDPGIWGDHVQAREHIRQAQRDYAARQSEYERARRGD